MRSFKLSLFFFSLFMSGVLSAAEAQHEHLVTPDFRVVRDAIDDQVDAAGPRNVLVVFDTDNTILATDTDFGGEHWSLWQSQLIQSQPDSKEKVAATMPQLFSIQGWILGLMSMHPVEKRIPQDIKQLNSKGVSSMVLTSRSIDLHDATLRELDRNGFAFSMPGHPATYVPFQLDRPETVGLSKEELKAFNVTSTTAVRYERGILLTEGQHKGLMLRAFLAASKLHFKSIVFVDDRSHHLDGVQAAFKGRSETVVTIQYTHEAAHIAAFNQSDKRVVKAQWCAFSKGLKDSIFVGIQSLPFAPCAN